MSKAAPRPLFWSRHQPPLHRIAVNVLQLVPETLGRADVVIVIALLPEVLRACDQPSRYSLLQRFQSLGQRPALRFAEQQVDVLRHHDVAVDAQTEVASHAFQRRLECGSCFHGREQLPPMEAAERDKVILTGSLVALQSRRHVGRLTRTVAPLKPNPGLSGPPASPPATSQPQPSFEILRQSGSGFRLRAPATLTPARRLKFPVSSFQLGPCPDTRPARARARGLLCRKPLQIMRIFLRCKSLKRLGRNLEYSSEIIFHIDRFGKIELRPCPPAL